MRIAIMAATLLAAALPAAADDVVKDGQPCLGEVCIEDDISTLSKVKWEVAGALSNEKPTAMEQRYGRQEKTLKGKFAPQSAAVVRDASEYLLSGSFDNVGISKLGKVTGFCVPIDLLGRCERLRKTA